MVETAVLGLGTVTLVIWLAFAVDAARGQRLLLYLRRVPVPAAEVCATLPRLSIVFGARNEERSVEAAVGTMLALDYPNLQIIAVNDRSDDATGEILDGLAAGDSRLAVLHVESLPEGWLGKNHALWVGAAASEGELILFTDADVKFERSVALRAVSWMTENDVDHVAGATDVEARGLGLQLFIATFALFFNAYFRPWWAADPNSKAYIGFGGFNLMRRAAYERAGTHAALAMDPLDDVNLGRRLKQSGSRQVCAVPGPMVKVEWYESLGAAIRGLEKNTMAGVNWSFALLFGGLLAQVLLAVWPFFAVVAVNGPARWLNLAIVVVIVTIHATMLSETSLPVWLPLLLPIGVMLVAWTNLRAAFLTYWRGGVHWRGTFYPLDRLRD